MSIKPKQGHFGSKWFKTGQNWIYKTTIEKTIKKGGAVAPPLLFPVLL